MKSHCALFLALLLTPLHSLQAAAVPEPKPNVLMIPVDDLNVIVLWSDNGYHIGEKEKLHKRSRCPHPGCHVLPNRVKTDETCVTKQEM
jgi:hypothetical protein